MKCVANDQVLSSNGKKNYIRENIACCHFSLFKFLLGQLTIPRDGLNDSTQQLVHQRHVQQVEGKEITVEPGAQR